MPSTGPDPNVIAELVRHQIGGSVLGVTSIGATGALGPSDGPVIALTANNITVNLPPISSTPVGRLFYFKDAQGEASSITIAADGSDLIDENAGYELVSAWESVTLVNTGNRWNVIAFSFLGV